MANVREYFEHKDGTGVLATSDSAGQVNAALYDRPNFVDDETVAFIMPDHLTHKDVGSNPHAAYLFVESGSRTKGMRLYLTKLREEKNSETICGLLADKKYTVPGGTQNKPLFLVYFHIDRTRALIEDRDAS